MKKLLIALALVPVLAFAGPRSQSFSSSSRSSSSFSSSRSSSSSSSKPAARPQSAPASSRSSTTVQSSRAAKPVQSPRAAQPSAPAPRVTYTPPPPSTPSRSWFWSKPAPKPAPVHPVYVPAYRPMPQPRVVYYQAQPSYQSNWSYGPPWWFWLAMYNNNSHNHETRRQLETDRRNWTRDGECYRCHHVER